MIENNLERVWQNILVGNFLTLQEFDSLPTEFTYYRNFVGKNRDLPTNYLQILGKYVFNNLRTEYLPFTY